MKLGILYILAFCILLFGEGNLSLSPKVKEFWKLVSVAAMLKLHRPMIDFLEHVLERQMN